MTSALIQQLRDTLGNLDDLSPDKLQALIDQTLKTFHQLQGKLSSTDPKEREDAMEAAMALKTALEEQTSSLCKKAGMEPEQLAHFIEDPSNFTKDQWEFLGSAKGELDDFKKHIGGDKLASEEAPKKKVSKKDWIAG